LESLGRVRYFERQLVARNAEIARLKGRPDVTPRGMEPGDKVQAGPSNKPRRGGGTKAARRAIHEVRVVKATVPPGSHFRSYQSFVVQDLVMRAYVVGLRRQHWPMPQGQSITASLRAGKI